MPHKKDILCKAFVTFVFSLWLMLWYCLLHAIYKMDQEGSVTYMLSIFCYIQLIITGKVYFNKEHHLEKYKVCFKRALYVCMPFISIAAAVVSILSTGFTLMVGIILMCAVIEVLAALYYFCCKPKQETSTVDSEENDTSARIYSSPPQEDV